MFDNKYFIKNDGAAMVRAMGKVFLNLSHLLKKSKTRFNFIWF